MLAITVCLAACSPADEASDEDETAAPPNRLVLAPSESAGETVPRVRQVIPGAAVHAPPPGARLERLPAPPVAPTPPRPVRLGIVVVEAANRLSTRRGMITLEGTRGIDTTTLCPLADGRTPPCHVLARTAVRRYVGQRSIACTLGLRDDAGRDHVAPCTIGDNDLALWLVANGWAFAGDAASDALLRAENEAEVASRGLWGMMTGVQPSATPPSQAR